MRAGKVYLPASWDAYGAMPQLIPPWLTPGEAWRVSEHHRFCAAEIAAFHEQQYHMLDALKWQAEGEKFREAEEVQTRIERQLRLFKRLLDQEWKQAQKVEGLLHALRSELGEGIERQPAIRVLLSWN